MEKLVLRDFFRPLSKNNYWLARFFFRTILLISFQFSLYSYVHADTHVDTATTLSEPLKEAGKNALTVINTYFNYNELSNNSFSGFSYTSSALKHD